MGAEFFKNIPFEEFYDLDKDPYETINLIQNKKYENQISRLKIELENWMVSQKDFLLHEKMPLLKPTLHPLDKESQWTKVPDFIKNKLNSEDYYSLHY
jgi:uncharacterized sulfatase